ncbi:hypothetical protein Clacol_004686 [Clathrus columnatus]|uniref:Uncharacterized protein n=1 Tax=Clathrus columnatus TaxID=1419009 RepID=A0AAV5AC13_9AGAM|nr:hypothetical protein Clacol_004686 [Clathrus columnatus]
MSFTKYLITILGPDTKHGVKMSYLEGNEDAIVAAGRIQGFSVQPQTVWYGPDGSPAGVVHQEKNVSYLIFANAGDLISHFQPSNPLFNGYNLPGHRNDILTGSGSVAGSTVWPSATIEVWKSFIKTAMTMPSQLTPS